MWCNKLFAFSKRDVIGATLVEYALICSLIAVILVGTLTSIGSKVQVPMNKVSAKL
ncbi:MAG: Flp family type IVb pilin [Pseudomonadota bacterium]